MNGRMIDFKQYIKELQSVPIDEITEHSKRSVYISIKLSILRQHPKRFIISGLVVIK